MLGSNPISEKEDANSLRRMITFAKKALHRSPKDPISRVQSNGLLSIKQKRDGGNGSLPSVASPGILSSDSQSSSAYSVKPRAPLSEAGSSYSPTPRSESPIPKPLISGPPPTRHPLYASPALTADFDLTIPVLISLRSEPVLDLTAHVKKEGKGPIFEGSYSNVWYGILNGEQYVAIKVLRDQRIGVNKALRTQERGRNVVVPSSRKRRAAVGLAKDPDFGAFGAMISPWYKNGNAAEYLTNNTVSVAQRIDLFHDVARGIHYLHTFETTEIHTDSASELSAELHAPDTTVVHGDLKPCNILVDDNGVGKLCDFGLLRLIREHASTGMTTSSDHTGTPRYLAHELVGGDSRPTHASDIHALACVGYEFIYFTRPYAHIITKNQLSDYHVRKAIDNKEPPAQRPKDPSVIISQTWDVFEKSWNLEPDQRPHASDICDFLHTHKQQLSEALPVQGDKSE